MKSLPQRRPATSFPNLKRQTYALPIAPSLLYNFYGFYKGVHNTYLNMIAEFGILGIPAFVIMLVSMLRRSRRAKFVLGFALLAGMCVIIFFLDSYFKKFFWNVILLVIIQGRIADKNGAEAL